MTNNLQQVIDAAERLWPAAGAESWDAPGLVCGNPAQSVQRVLLTVDVTSAVLSEAIDGCFDLILAHHPYLMRGVTTLAEDSQKGALISRAIRHGVAIFAAHTNADIVEDGVSDSIAKKLGLTGIAPLVAASGSSTVGHGRVGELLTRLTLAEFAQLVASVMPATAAGVRVAGAREHRVLRVALCGGAGDSFIQDAIAAEADVYLTSDLRHHPAQDAIEQGLATGRPFALVDVAHWASESLWLEVAAAQLAGIFEDVQIVVSGLNTDPWDFAVH